MSPAEFRTPPRRPRPVRAILLRAFAGVIMLALAVSSIPPAAYAQEGGGEAMVQQAVFQEARVEQVLTSISNQAGVSITAFGQVPGSRVSIFEKDPQPLEDILNKLAQPNSWVWFRQDDGSYGLADEAWFKANILPERVITKIFRPDHVKASELENAVSPMLTQGISSITADDRTNKLIISDLPEVIERIERLIREIDVQLMTRVFYIRNGDVAEIAEKIESYKSDPGTIEVDQTTHQIIVTDLLSNIKKMELLIDILDVGPEIVIYDVNNIGLDGEDLEDLQNIIETIRTPELLFEINHKQGVFILEDVPEVHERVEQILAGFDQPVKQVLIQGEILSTSFNRNFGLGVNSFDYSSQALPIADGASLIPDDGGVADFNFSGNTISGTYLDTYARLSWSATFDQTDAKVLLQPRLLVKNQESSRIFVGSEEPYITTFFNDNNQGGTTRSESQQTVTDGLTFEITPSISNSYLVEMEIQIDNDDAERVDIESQGGTRSLIRRDRQSVETVLTMPSGQTRVIGGLITQSDNESNSGIPFLSTLPVLKYLLGSTNQQASRSVLQLFITPTIVEDVIPRDLNEDGRRGRLVSGYERVPGSFDLNAEAEFEEMQDAGPDGLFESGIEDSEGMIEDLMREDTARPQFREEDRNSNFRRRQTGNVDTPENGGSSEAQVPDNMPVAPGSVTPGDNETGY